MGINQILSFHIPRNLKRFSMKPNIGIATFLGITFLGIWMLEVMWIPPNQTPP